MTDPAPLSGGAAIHGTRMDIRKKNLILAALLGLVALVFYLLALYNVFGLPAGGTK